MEDVMLIVSDDRAVVEADLAAGRLLCPRCGVGVLGGWGCARLRVLRTREGERRLRPRRGRCREQACLATHVLLPDVCLARRLDAVEVIGEALLRVELSQHFVHAQALAQRNHSIMISRSHLSFSPTPASV